ncbi:MAG: pyridoxamine 5'-phosphate oxidase family protein [Halobacteriovoraceae bacterium]|nr:pyridoxamine 5'-phosphate oxidase family protein [Halobacteriovoraceae bacterium]
MKDQSYLKMKRAPQREVKDFKIITEILDEILLCNIGFSDQGRVFVIPTIFTRIDNHIYIHGSTASRLINSACDGQEVCISVTIVDALVMARSAFSHSMNYRSVVIFSKGTLVEDHAEKLEVLKSLTEKTLLGRWDHARKPNKQEMEATSVVKFSLDQMSAKQRQGGPKDKEADLDLDVWAGIIPLKLKADTPIAEPGVSRTLSLPDSFKHNYGMEG